MEFYGGFIKIIHTPLSVDYWPLRQLTRTHWAHIRETTRKYFNTKQKTEPANAIENYQIFMDD